MNFKEVMRIFFVHFFIIYTATMFATLFVCMSSNPGVVFGIEYIWQTGLFSLAADLPIFIYCTKSPLSKRQFWIRTALHTMVQEAVLLPIGYAIDMYDNTLGGVIIAFVILAVNVFVRTVSYLMDRHTADAINRFLKEKRVDSGQHN